MKILIVDDDQFVRDSLYALLDHCEFDVGTAVDGPQSLTVVESFQPDCVLLDWNLGGTMNGLAVSKAIYELSPNIRIVMISGDLNLQDLVAGQPFDFLMKPFQLPELLAILAKTPTNK